ncbi:MAG: TonB family protein [Opitutae bacterium]|nr:TonB family protein [Opitutae bacterium]
MNIQRFILPASVAATLHVALLWALPVEPFTPVVPARLIRADPPPPRTEEDLPIPSQDEKGAADKPVRQLAVGPPPPENPEPFDRLRPETLSIPVKPRPRKADGDFRIIPAVFGPGELGTPGLPGGPVFSPDQLDRVPNAKVRIPPEYPFALKQTGTEGSVTVEFDVDRSGRVVGARVLRSTHAEFEAPTLRAVLKWRFEPGRRHGKAVPFRLQVPVDFRLG